MTLSLPEYKVWEKKFREFTAKGINVVVAWNMANKHFGMNYNKAVLGEKE